MKNESTIRQAQYLEELFQNCNITQNQVHKVVNALLYNSAPEVRWRAIEVLRISGNRSSKTMKALLNALIDSNYYVRWHARNFLRKSYNIEETIPFLLKALENKDPRIREDAAEELFLLGANSDQISSALIRALRYDSDSEVRVQAAITLTNIKNNNSNIISAARETLSNPDLTIRFFSALILKKYNLFEPQVIDVFMEALDNRLLASRAWSALIDAFLHLSKNGSSVLKIPLETSKNFLNETISRGILPTIGMKIWHKPLPIEIPTHMDSLNNNYPFVWEDEGVFHSWNSHKLWAEKSYPLTIHQLCFHSDWFSKVHLVAISQLILFAKRDFDFKAAPVKIEGKEVGFITQTGGTLCFLEHMRVVSPPFRTNRIDFVHGFLKNAQMVQYLMFCGTCKSLLPSGLTSLEKKATDIWDDFCASMTEIFRRYELSELSTTEWFDKKGWKSIRYGNRYERSYTEIRPLLTEMGKVLSSANGDRLRKEVYNIVNNIVMTVNFLLTNELLEKQINEKSQLGIQNNLFTNKKGVSHAY